MTSFGYDILGFGSGGLVEFTAEYIVYTHMLDLVSMEVATHVTELLIDADAIVEL